MKHTLASFLTMVGFSLTILIALLTIASCPSAAKADGYGTIIFEPVVVPPRTQPCRSWFGLPICHEDQPYVDTGGNGPTLARSEGKPDRVRKINRVTDRPEPEWEEPEPEPEPERPQCRPRRDNSREQD